MDKYDSLDPIQLYWMVSNPRRIRSTYHVVATIICKKPCFSCKFQAVYQTQRMMLTYDAGHDPWGLDMIERWILSWVRLLGMSTDGSTAIRHAHRWKYVHVHSECLPMVEPTTRSVLWQHLLPSLPAVQQHGRRAPMLWLPHAIYNSEACHKNSWRRVDERPDDCWSGTSLAPTIDIC